MMEETVALPGKWVGWGGEGEWGGVGGAGRADYSRSNEG